MSCITISYQLSANRSLSIIILCSIGVLLSAVISSDATKAPFLLIMDARTMKEMGRVVYEGAGIPRGAHGLFSAGSIPS